MPNDNVLSRVKRVLRIEEEPLVGNPLVAAKEARRATETFLDDAARVADILSRAKAASVARPAAPEQPQLVKRRVEIMVSGGLGRVAAVANAVRDLQTQLFDQVGDDNLELRFTAFLDGCRHSTPWSRSPLDVRNSTTRWHCFRGQTLFAEALAYSLNETDPVDAVVMFGDRFDDDLARCLEIADRLKDKGTRIYAFHVGYHARAGFAYQQLAERTGGSFVKLSSPRAFARVMPVIAAHLVQPAGGLRALPVSRDADVQALIDRLKSQPPPPVLRLTWRK
jgi:hypothetical protein